MNVIILYETCSDDCTYSYDNLIAVFDSFPSVEDVKYYFPTYSDEKLEELCNGLEMGDYRLEIQSVKKVKKNA